MAYPFGWRQSVEVFTALERILPLPRSRPLWLLGGHGLLQCFAVVPLSIASQMNPCDQRSGTHSTGFFRLRTIPRSAHSKLSTCGDTAGPSTPLSMSCGPRWASFGGKAELNRERNMTMNYTNTSVFPCELRRESPTAMSGLSASVS